MTSIGARVAAARQALVLIRACHLALETNGLGDTGVTREDLLPALAAQAERLSLELHWLSLLPDRVLGAPSPDDDEADDADHHDRAAGRAKIVELTLLSRLAGVGKGE